MSTGRAERMLHTFKIELKKMVEGQHADWEECLPQVLLGYQCRRHATGLSPFELMFWLVACMNQSEPIALMPGSLEEHHRLENTASMGLRATSRCKQLG